MRTFLAIFLLIFSLTYSSFSQESEANKSIKTVMSLLNDDMEKNNVMIRKLCKDLTNPQKTYIYHEFEKSPVLPLILNIFPAFGIGSWVQGDAVGGTIGTVGELGGVIIMVVGAIKQIPLGDGGGNQSGSGNTIAVIGTVILLGSYVFDIILPFVYSNNYNSHLEKNLLGISGLTNLKILPNINVAGNRNIAPGVRLQFGF